MRKLVPATGIGSPRLVMAIITAPCRSGAVHGLGAALSHSARVRQLRPATVDAALAAMTKYPRLTGSATGRRRAIYGCEREIATHRSEVTSVV